MAKTVHGAERNNGGAFLVKPGRHVDLRAIDPGDTGPHLHKANVKEELERQRCRIETLQERLYAEHQRSVLIVLQAIDAGGKDGTISHVFEGVNPQGCRVYSFKRPSQDEVDHDFLWRYHARTPARGMITIFNRSYYEDVLVVRVEDLVPESTWRPRYDMINEFESMLNRNGTTVLKFFLLISREEQKRRFQERLDTPDKRWKFNVADLAEREKWDRYRSAFQDAINRCTTSAAPWHVVPANKKWYRNLVVARTIADTLEAMNPQFPEAQERLENIVIPD